LEKDKLMTPEGKIKKLVKDLLDEHGAKVWRHMAVTNGMGAPTLDFTGSAYGLFFAIETKAPGAKPTARQELTIEAMQAANGRVFVIDGDLTELRNWLNLVKATRKKLAESV